MNNKINNDNQLEQGLFLSEILGNKIILHGKKIGKLKDIVILETETIPEVTHFIVGRSFGYPSLMIPWKNVVSVKKNEVIIDIENIEEYEKEPLESQVLLKDHIIDKKVLDMDDNEVEVVYDVKLVLRSGKLYVTEVDSSKYGLFRRIGLRFLANFIYKLAERIKSDTIPWTYVQPLPENLSSFKGNVKLNILKDKLNDIHPVDLADILEELDHDQRMAIFNELETEHASDTLEEIEPRVQRDLIASLTKQKAAELINDMTPGQAADILTVLPASEADEILKLLDKEDAQKIEFLLDKQEENILNFTTSHFMKFSPDTKAGYILSQFREIAKDKDVVTYFYVVDEHDKLLGIADIKEVLEANSEDKLEDIMTSNVISLNPDDTLLEASRMFSRYSFRAIPVTDNNDIILGVIPYRDIMNLKHRFI